MPIFSNSELVLWQMKQ